MIPIAANITNVSDLNKTLNVVMNNLNYPQAFFKIVIPGILALTIWIAPAWAIDYDKRIMVGYDFSGQDLTDSSFDKANLREANFSKCNLNKVRFFAANLESANLEEADLRQATLDSARLTRANLKNANLEGAFAANAKFEQAIIEGADFTGVLLRLDTQKKLCNLAKGTNPVTGRNTFDTLECY